MQWGDNSFLQAKGVACSISADISALLYIKYEVDNGENSPLVSVRDSDLNTWLSLLNKEINTLEKIIRSDEKRFKDTQAICNTQTQVQNNKIAKFVA